MIHHWRCNRAVRCGSFSLVARSRVLVSLGRHENRVGVKIKGVALNVLA